MDAQQILDTVAAHLRAQKACATNGDKCAYRAPDGRKCALGVLIPDELYESRFEDMSASWVLSASDGLQAMFPEQVRQLLGELQQVHDREQGYPEPDFEPGLALVAKKFGLVLAEPTC